MQKYNDKGVLVVDMRLPEYYRKYWSNGALQVELVGDLYKDEHGTVCVRNGDYNLFFPDGRPKRLDRYENKIVVSHKEWNEKGVLTDEYRRREMLRSWYDDGTPKSEIVADIRIDDSASFENGTYSSYFPNGKPQTQYKRENGEVVVLKSWNEDGSPDIEWSFPDSLKKFHPGTGTPMMALRGTLYHDEKSGARLQDGTENLFSEDGTLVYHADYANRFAKRAEWPTLGKILELERDDSNNLRTARLLLNGTLIREKSGGLIEIDRDKPDIDSIKVYNGEEKKFFPDGTPKTSTEWGNGEIVTMKIWNEKGVLTDEYRCREMQRSRYDDGTLKFEAFGDVRIGDGEAMENGTGKWYFPNGKPEMQIKKENGELVDHKKWNEKGILIYEQQGSKSVKTWYDDGKSKRELSGELYQDSEGTWRVKNGVLKGFFPDGKKKSLGTYKDGELVTAKEWHKNGNLAFEAELSSHFLRVYREDGTLGQEGTGTISLNDKGWKVKDGTFRSFGPDGRTVERSVEYKDSKPVAE
ncbi:MAG: hypothetical protein J6Y56_08950 [Fibrobacterales bacterium]|nr:hypothetical protein [Fibrobacterales bacterium]